MSWAARNLAAYLATGPVTTTITPSTGSLSVTGQPAHVRPLDPTTGALALTGQTLIIHQNIRITPQTGSLTLTGQTPGVGQLSTIVSAEYVGDGASSRSFASASFAPLVVIVIGKDGSGNVVGAIKTATMPSGKSQPLNQNVAASDASRSNRITSLDSNGFTVGSDLNASGRSYAYVMLPAGRANVVNVGEYVGHGGAPTRNSNIHIPSGGGTLTADTSAWDVEDADPVWHRPAGGTAYSAGISLVKAGRRIIRDSDGAVIAELSGFTSTTNAAGIGYIAGTFGGGSWHLEEDYIDVPGFGGLPDLVLFFADDTAANSLPTTIVAPAFMSSTNASWQGTGAGELDAFFGGSGDSRLHVYPNIGYSTKGVTFRWIAFRSDEAGTGIKMATFQYTGDASGPINLTGLDFAPEWAIAFSSSTDFAWAKRSTAIIGSGKARHWTDGSGDLNQYNPTFVSDGLTIPSGAGQVWNGTGTKYTFLLIVADPQRVLITPSTGSLALTGKTPTVTVPTITRITPNTAELHAIGKQPTLTPHFTRITPGTGSLIIALKQPLRAQKRVITPKTGKLNLTGKAVRTKESKGHKIPISTAEDPPTGGLQIFGKQPVLKISIIPRTGALTATGQHCFARPPEFPIIPRTGALTATGQPVQRRVIITPGTGRLVADGQASLVNLSIPPRRTNGTGILGLVGRQPILKITVIPQAGELNFATFSTEPILRREVTTTFIIPRAGDLSISGVSPATNPDVVVTTVITPQTGSLTLTGRPAVIPSVTSITPQTGTLTLQGQQPTLERGVVRIIPGTGALNFVGQPVIVSAPSPTPPVPPVAPEVGGGGIGLPHPRKLPFWPKPVCRVSAVLEAPVGMIDIRAEAEENELDLLLLI